MNIKTILILCLFTLAGITSCKKEETSISEGNGSFVIEFENMVNNFPLVLNSKTYTNANGDNFNISVFKYYISNIILTRTDGSTYKIPESYILVDASKPASILNTLSNVPSGDYTSISFTIGIDKERNLAGAQTGALDPSLGMFWTWNSGYIFLKLEGSSPQSTAANQGLTFHIGGIVEPNNTIRTFSSEFTTGNPLRIRTDKKPQVHFKVNVESLFTGKTKVAFSSLNFTMGGANSMIIADNYASGLFEFEHIHN